MVRLLGHAFSGASREESYSRHTRGYSLSASHRTWVPRINSRNEKSTLPSLGDRMELTELPAHALSNAIRSGEVSCREVMQTTLARIEAINPTVNAFVRLRAGAQRLRQ